MRSLKLTVLAYGEGEDERTFLRHLSSCYSRTNTVSVQTGSAGGGNLKTILEKAIAFRRGYKRDYEFVFLDTDLGWDDESVQRAADEEFKLIGNTPSLESFFFEILGSPNECDGLGAGRCKNLFETNHCGGHNFNEEKCAELFPKSVLNEARKRMPDLDYMIKVMEGINPSAE